MKFEEKISQAIQNVDAIIDSHRQSARALINVMSLLCGGIIIYAGGSTFLVSHAASSLSNLVYEDSHMAAEFNKEASDEALKKLSSSLDGALSQVKNILSYLKPVTFFFLFIFVLVFGAIMAIYRFHMGEISRSQRFKLGLLRVNVASGEDNDCNEEICRALVADAFALLPEKDKKIDNPLPGNISSEMMVILLNKLLEGLEVKKKV